MLANVSKRLLWVVLVLGGIGAGTYLVLGSSDTDEPATASEPSDLAGLGSSEVPPAECSRPAARDAVLGSEFEAGVRELGVVQPGDPLFGGSGYFVTELICRDLTDDRVADMVVRLDCCAGGTPTPWAIFVADGDEWRPALYRAGIQASLQIEDGGVVERSAAYGAGEPICCPTTARAGRVEWDGSAFVYRSEEASVNRAIRVSSQGVDRLGEFRPATGSPTQASNAFGPPSYVMARDDVCVYEWRDLGLLINFVNVGGLDPCRADVQASSVELKDEFAAQAHWETDRGLRVGMSLADLRELYPQARSQSAPGFGEVLTLIQGRALVGIARADPILSARIADGAVDELTMSVATAT
jgi:hypothetical protein